MNAKNGFKLEKLIVGDKPLDNRENILFKINKYIDIRNEPRHQFVNPIEMRLIYNECIQDIAFICDTSKNGARKNIYYVTNYNLYSSLYPKV